MPIRLIRLNSFRLLFYHDHHPHNCEYPRRYGDEFPDFSLDHEEHPAIRSAARYTQRGNTLALSMREVVREIGKKIPPRMVLDCARWVWSNVALVAGLSAGE